MDNILIAFVFIFILDLLFILPSSYNKLKNQDFKPKVEKKSKPKFSANKDILTQMGNHYEKLVGFDFEKKCDLVIYNGFIKGNQDGGVDVIAFNKNIIYLIQCKNWHKMELHIDLIEKIYVKLSNYKLSALNMNQKDVQKHLQKRKSLKEIEQTLLKIKTQKNKKMEKYLFLSNEKVITNHVKANLKKINNYLFLYKDMKIVIYKD